MGYVVLHLDKASANETKMTAHIERTQIPANANPKLTYLNCELVEFPKGVENRTAAIQHRLDNAGLTRKIGTNQVRAIRIMLTGSNKDMKRIEAEGRLGQWCDDNLDWLRKTYGVENLVSAVLHLDEATPHIHATVVPIVTGERRRVKEKKNDNTPGKKQYRKKDRSATRLCADDVMTKVKLKEYQTTYAQAMNKYGLERSIDGSQARHITTQEFYRNAIAQKVNLQENITELLQIEELKRKAVEQLKSHEQETTARYRQADILKREKERELSQTEAELKDVKGQLKTEKFKSSAADAGSAILDGISSALGTNKVKRQQYEIGNLKTENHNLLEEIIGLNQTIARERKEHEKTTDALKNQLNRIYDWLPDTKALICMGEYCKSVGFSDNMIKDLVNMKPVYFSGELYSREHSLYFKTTKSEARLERDLKNPGRFSLLINRINIIDWFKQKYRQLQEKLGINIPDKREDCTKGIKR